jgi:putative FmdB family regulatory protein
MPIYEFYCEDCNTIFNFFSRSINTRKQPNCPKCNKKKLSRQMSAFAVTGRASEDGEMDDLPFDENKMEQAMQMLAGEAETINEDDPRQAADLMRKLSHLDRHGARRRDGGGPAADGERGGSRADRGRFRRYP